MLVNKRNIFICINGELPLKKCIGVYIGSTWQAFYRKGYYPAEAKLTMNKALDEKKSEEQPEEGGEEEKA